MTPVVNTCGLHGCPLREARKLMPELEPQFQELFPKLSMDIFKPSFRDYVVDVKVHMLMPGQWPCIPNWHRDFVPRDEDGNLDENRIQPDEKMFLWLSGPPYTEFRELGGHDTYCIGDNEWVEFTQSHWHRGTPSDRFTWRTFIRVAPTTLQKVNPPEMWIRRHSQVYLDASNFTW